jgi:alkanesulfonate monooxygenase SsuD/methylene tetrahydromethanopterin reductase-like flavin-dependent oxidoreductase (luciferase family)
VSQAAVKVGVMLPTFREIPTDAISIAIEAEDLGIDGVFLYDHLWPMGRPDRPALAPFPMLGAIAASTSTLRLGTLVARVGLVPDETLVAGFAALDLLAPGRVIAGLGTGDHLSFNENRAYGIALHPAAVRRAAVARCGHALQDLGIEVWVGGSSAATVAVAEELQAVSNFWQATTERVAEQAGRSQVTWGGMFRSGGASEWSHSGDLSEVARSFAEAGASWLVFGWPIRLDQLAETAESIRAGT